MTDTPRPVEPPLRPSGADVLVSGAGFAGLATAYWLDRLGHRVTMVEIASGLRKGGTPVDIEGETIGILERMGLIDAVRAKALPPRTFEFKDADDGTIGAFASHNPAAGAANERYEMHRDDLLDILYAAIEGSTEIMFGQSISQMDEKPDGVSVTFGNGSRRNYALVVGCDGNRSTTRRLAFADAGDASYFMGGYFLIKVVPVTGLLPANVSQIFSVAGRTAIMNGYDDRTDVILAFRTEREIDYDYRDRGQQRRIIQDHLDGLGWKVPVMLDHLNVDNDFYFDRLNQIRMPVWSTGRVVLVGDAGYCVSPVAGMGGSVAIIGAARLADALQRHGADHVAAFKEYHEKLRLFIEEVQEKAVSSGMPMMFPLDDAAIAARDRKLISGTVEHE